MSQNVSKTERGDAPLCSVCIANFNGASYVEECIDSVIKQENLPGIIEIVVHDDASTDNSVNLIRTRYPQVHLLISDSNVGFCISNNRMVAEANGEFILLLNNDAILHPDALRTFFDSSTGNRGTILGLPQYDITNKELIDIGSKLDLFLNPIPNMNALNNRVGMIIGACMWIPKSLWHNLGGFPEWFETLAEDMYICCLARLWGYSVNVIASSGFDHWIGKSIGGGKVLEDKKLSTTFARRFLSERNKSYVMITCYPSPLAWLLVPLHFIVLSLEGIIISLVKWDNRIWSNIYLLAIQEVWKNRNKLLKIRSINQKSKKISCREFFLPFSFIPHKLRMLIRHGLPHIVNK